MTVSFLIIVQLEKLVTIGMKTLAPHLRSVEGISFVLS